MKFIILLIVLAVERYTQLNDRLLRFNWFDSYLKLLRKWFTPTRMWQGIFGVLLTLLPLLIIVAIIYYLLYPIFYNVIGYLLSLLILMYCLGPDGFYTHINHFLQASEQGSAEAALQQVGQLAVEKPQNQAELHREATKGILLYFNEAIFGVLFWFVILGPVGALLYRVIVLINKAAHQPDSEDKQLAHSAHCCQQLLDWIPARLLSLGYTLVGHFAPSFHYWWRHVWSGLGNNAEIINQSGLIALDVANTEATSASIEENKHAIALIDRCLILYLVVIALVVLGSML